MHYALTLITVLQLLLYSSTSQGNAVQVVSPPTQEKKVLPFLIVPVFNSRLVKSNPSQTECPVDNTFVNRHLSLFKISDVKKHSLVYMYYLTPNTDISIRYDPVHTSKIKPQTLIAYHPYCKGMDDTLTLYGTTKNHQVFELTGRLNKITNESDYKITVRLHWSSLLDTLSHDKLQQLAHSLSKSTELWNFLKDQDEKTLKETLQSILPLLTEAQLNYQHSPLISIASTYLLKTMQFLGSSLLSCLFGPDQQDSRLRAHSY